MKFKIRHKSGWTGTLTLESMNQHSTASHFCAGIIDWTCEQDSRGADGQYFEEPEIDGFNDIEILTE